MCIIDMNSQFSKRSCLIYSSEIPKCYTYSYLSVGSKYFFSEKQH